MKASVIFPTNKVLEIFVHRARFFHPSFLDFLAEEMFLENNHMQVVDKSEEQDS